MSDPVQVLSWINFVFALGSYVLATHTRGGLFAFERPLYHLVQLAAAINGIVIFTLGGIPAWVAFNAVWLGISGKKLIDIYREAA